MITVAVDCLFVFESWKWREVFTGANCVRGWPRSWLRWKVQVVWIDASQKHLQPDASQNVGDARPTFSKPPPPINTPIYLSPNPIDDNLPRRSPSAQTTSSADIVWNATGTV